VSDASRIEAQGDCPAERRRGASGLARVGPQLNWFSKKLGGNSNGKKTVCACGDGQAAKIEDFRGTWTAFA